MLLRLCRASVTSVSCYSLERLTVLQLTLPLHLNNDDANQYETITKDERSNTVNTSHEHPVHSSSNERGFFLYSVILSCANLVS